MSTVHHPVHISSWRQRPPVILLEKMQWNLYHFHNFFDLVKKVKISFFSTNKSRFQNQRGWRGLRQNILDFDSLHHLGFWLLQQWLQPFIYCLFNTFLSLLDPNQKKTTLTSNRNSLKTLLCSSDRFSQLRTRHCPRPIIKSRTINETKVTGLFLES